MAFTQITLSNPAVNPETPNEVYELNWNLHDSKKYKENGNGIVLRYPLFRANSNMYQYGYQPTIEDDGSHTYDSAYLRFPDLAEYQPGNEYLGRTETSHGSYVFVVNEAQDHFTLHNFGSNPDKTKSDLSKNEPAEVMTMVEDEYDENKLQWEGFPRNVYLDGQADWAKIARTVEATVHTARIFECVESHIGASKLLGYETELIIRDGGEGYKADEEVIVSNRFIEQKIKVVSVDENGAITDFTIGNVEEESEAKGGKKGKKGKKSNTSNHKFKTNRNIDNTLGDSTAFVDYGVSYQADRLVDDETFEKATCGKGATFNYNCEPYYASNELSFYDNEEYNRWSYIKDVYVYLEGDAILAVDFIGDNTEATVNKYIASETVIPLNEWSETADKFELVSKFNNQDAPYDLGWVKASDLTGSSVSGTVKLHNHSTGSFSYVVFSGNPNEAEVVPTGANAVPSSTTEVDVSGGDLWLKIPFGQFASISVEK